MKIEQTQSDSAETPVRKIAVKIFGVGGAGVTVAGQMASGGFAAAEFVAVDADARSLAATGIATKLHLEMKVLRGLGTGGDPERGRQAADEQLPKLKDACAGADVVFLMVGLGGGAGTGISPVLARVARESGALVLAFVTQPFAYEGNLRQTHARHGLKELKAAADAVVCLPNSRISQLIDENTSLLEVFQTSGGLLIEAVQGVWRLLTQRGLIEIHYEELAVLIRDSHSESCVATVEASGDGRAQEAIERLLKHPMLDAGKAFASSDAMLVSVLGGPDLSMAHVNRVMEAINGKADHAKIIMGAAVEDGFQGRLSVTVIATRRDGRELQKQTVAEPRATEAPELESQLLDQQAMGKPASRIIPPAPELTTEQRERLLTKQAGVRGKKAVQRMKQGQLPLEIVSRGRFDKSEPTIHKGQDLDLPTYIRRGLSLN